MPPAPCTIGSRTTAATSSSWRSNSAASSATCDSSNGAPKTGEGAGAKSCSGSTEEKRWCMPVTGSHTDIAPSVSPWYPERTVSRRRRDGRPRPCQYWIAILIATSTETEPESLKKTCDSPSGASSTSSSASSTAGAWVSPPNMTCDMRPSWSRTASSSTGWR